MGEYLQYVADVFTALFGFQERLFDKMEVWGIIFACFFVFTASRLLIIPIVGGFISAGTSDVVNRHNKTGRHKPKQQKSSGKKGG